MTGTFYEEQIVIPLATYSGASSIFPPQIYKSGQARGVLMTLVVTVAGTSNLQLRYQAFDALSGVSYVPINSSIITTTGTFVMAIGRGVAMQPAGEAADTTAAAIVRTCGLPLPDRWRPNVGKGDASAWTFGLSMRYW